MSQTSQSFIEQLEAAVTPAVIGTKKAAKALAPSDIETSQQDKLGDMKAYKRRQKKMEKGLLNQEVEIDQKEVSYGEESLSELASLFQGITGQEPEEEPKVIEPVILSEPEPIVPYIDPRVIEEATNELQALFTDMSGTELFGQRPQFEEEVIEIPVTPPETFDISEVSDVASRIFGTHQVLPDTTLYNPADVKHTQVVQDVDDLLEKHKEDLPEEQFQILKTDGPDKTANYLSKANIQEYDTSQSMPLTGANAPLVSSPMFTTAVTGILRKMMATGPGTGVVELTKLDDVDPSLLSATHQFLAWDAAQSKFVGAEGTTPIGDISGVIAGTGLSGGGTQGTVTLNVEASQTQITALGTIGTGTWQGTAITNAYIGTGINATKLANGSVTNTELQYINSLSSNAQTQLDSKPGSSFVTAMAIALG